MSEHGFSFPGVDIEKINQILVKQFKIVKNQNFGHYFENKTQGTMEWQNYIIIQKEFYSITSC